MQDRTIIPQNTCYCYKTIGRIPVDENNPEGGVKVAYCPYWLPCLGQDNRVYCRYLHMYMDFIGEDGVKMCGEGDINELQ